MRLRLAEIAKAVGGRLTGADPAAEVDGVVVDSRLAAPGSLFAAVPGERVDGHDFAAAAVAAGAVAVLAGRTVPVPAIVVPRRELDWPDADGRVLAALGRLARYVLDRRPGTTVTAVTGSSGKTSTKDLLGQVLASAGPTVSAAASYNNDLGVALTALRIAADTEHLVVEMGARGGGQVARLCRIAPPQVGVVLNVGLAHVGEFGSRAAIATAKRELVEALPATGTAVLNADDPLVAAMAAASPAPVLWYGWRGPAEGAAAARQVDIAADHVRLDDSGRPRFRLRTPTGSAEVALALIGEHHVSNALAAAAVGHRAGIGVAELAAVLSAATPRSRWRMEVHRRPDGVTVINDAYNANPDSMRAALRALVASARGGRTWAVLGEMLELGPTAAPEHEAIGGLAAELGVSRLVVVGEEARAIMIGASRSSAGGRDVDLVPDAAAARALLEEHLRPGDTVLVKASNAVGLGPLGEALAGQTAADPGPAA